MGELVLILTVVVLVSAAMAGVWQVVRKGAPSGWIDAVWTFSTGGAALVLALVRPDMAAPAPRAWLVAAMAAAWSLRLGVHIARRAASGGDDPRYAWLKKKWGGKFDAELFRFLQIQAFAGLLLALAAWLAARNPVPVPQWTDYLGLAIFAGAVIGEAVSDAQLAAFKKNPANAGKINDRGLWGWSRHPNYFFEWLVWLGFAVMAAGAGLGWPWGFAAFLAPLFMLWLLTKASGIPPLEAHMRRTRGAAWDAYVSRTSAFFPLPPKQEPKS